MPRVQITPLDKRALERLVPETYEPPTRDALQKWIDDVVADARSRAPQDTGDLAGSLRGVVEGSPPVARVTSNSRKFRYVHGAFAIPAPPRRRSRPHFPPDNQSIRAWAGRHGIPAFAVRRAIAENGTPIVPFVAEAVEEALPRLDALLAGAAREVERRFAT